MCPKQCIKYVFNLYLSFYFQYYCGKLWYIQTCNHCVAIHWVYILNFQVLERKCRKNINQRKIFRKPERLKGGRSCACLSLRLWESTKVRNEKGYTSKAPCVWAGTVCSMGMIAMGWRLHLILEVFSNLWFYDSTSLVSLQSKCKHDIIEITYFALGNKLDNWTFIFFLL